MVSEESLTDSEDKKHEGVAKVIDQADDRTAPDASSRVVSSEETERNSDEVCPCSETCCAIDVE